MDEKTALEAQMALMEWVIRQTYSGMPLPWVRTQLLKRHEELRLALDRAQSNFSGHIHTEQPIA